MMDVGNLTTAVNALADLRNHLPTPSSSSSSSSFSPAAVVDFPKNTQCIGPAGLILMIQNLFDSTDEIGDTFTPIFPPSVKKALGLPFLEGFIAVGYQHANFERWAAVSPAAGSNTRSGPLSVMNIQILTELDNRQAPIGFGGTMVARVLYLVRATLKTRPDLTKDFIKLGGVHMMKGMFSSSSTSLKYADTVQKMFCEVVGDFQNDPLLLKKFLELDFASILLSFAKEGKNDIVRRFSISLVDSLRGKASFKALQKNSKENSCAALMTAMVEIDDLYEKTQLVYSLNEILSVQPALKEEFMLPCNCDPFVRLLKTLLSDREKLMQQGSSANEGQSQAWWLASAMITSLGTAVGGSAERQRYLGRDLEVIPLLIEALSWNLRKENMSTQIVATLYKAVARTEENAVQIWRHPQGLKLLFDYFFIYFLDRRPYTKANFEVTVWNMALLAINNALYSAEPGAITAETRDKLWRCFEALVSLYDSPQASYLSFDNVASVNSFFQGVLTLPVHGRDKAQQLQWFLRCCHQRGTQNVPYLTIMTEMQSRNGLIHLNFPAQFMSKLYDFYDMHLSCLGQIMAAFEPVVNSLLSSEREREKFQWVQAKLTAGVMLSKIVAGFSMSRGEGGRTDSPTDDLPRNPISVHHKQSRKTAAAAGSSGTGSAPTHVCANGQCYNYQNLKACGKCRNLYYCDPSCQKQHWKLHKTDCA